MPVWQPPSLLPISLFYLSPPQYPHSRPILPEANTSPPWAARTLLLTHKSHPSPHVSSSPGPWPNTVSLLCRAIIWTASTPSWLALPFYACAMSLSTKHTQRCENKRPKKGKVEIKTVLVLQVFISVLLHLSLSIRHLRRIECHCKQQY